MLKPLQTAQVQGKNVLVRIDADVLDKKGQLKDDSRLQVSVPTIKHLLENGAKVTIIGHIGRPKGKEIAELKMRPVEDKLIELLGTHQNWQILENLRFNPGEEKNDPEFARHLAAGQDIFVQDAFATCHREHASIIGVKNLLPTFAGLSVQNEIDHLNYLLYATNIVIIIGGKKGEDKLPVIANLANKTQAFLIGGVIANTFLARMGIKVGKSLVEDEVFEATDAILKQWSGTKLHLPIDVVTSLSITQAQDVKSVNVKQLAEISQQDFWIVDIGPNTISQFEELISKAEIIFWSGNMGISEIPEFASGSEAIAKAITASQAKKYAGGGDTAKFLKQAGLNELFDFVSNGGGATLEFLAGKQLPGL
jgi:phosphoglycerate kinase